MWKCAARNGGRIGLSKLRSSASPSSSCRAMSAGASPLGEGKLEFQTKKLPSFWSRLKDQKQGLGNMALSASVGFLALSIIQQEKELKRAKESASQLGEHNEALKEKLEKLKSALVKSDAGEKSSNEVLLLLRDVVNLNGGEGALESPVETEKSRSKFMI